MIKYILMGLLLSVNALAMECSTDRYGTTTCQDQRGSTQCSTDRQDPARHPKHREAACRERAVREDARATARQVPLGNA